jgi:hypothetical protein
MTEKEVPIETAPHPATVYERFSESQLELLDTRDYQDQLFFENGEHIDTVTDEHFGLFLKPGYEKQEDARIFLVRSVHAAWAHFKAPTVRFGGGASQNSVKAMDELKAYAKTLQVDADDTFVSLTGLIREGEARKAHKQLKQLNEAFEVTKDAHYYLRFDSYKDENGKHRQGIFAAAKLAGFTYIDDTNDPRIEPLIVGVDGSIGLVPRNFTLNANGLVYRADYLVKEYATLNRTIEI